MQKITYINCKLNLINFEELLNFIKSNIDQNNKVNHVLINASTFLDAQKDKDFLGILNQFQIATVDGMGLYFALKLNKLPIKERIAGPDLFEKVLELSQKEKYRVYFLGTTEENINKMIDNIRVKYPHLIIAGYRNGFFNLNDMKDLLENIDNSNSHILLLGLPSPIKEQFIIKYGNIIKCNYILGVGGVFDIIAGDIKRAPILLQKIGLEWFFRFAQEPKRLWKRYLIGNFQYVCIILSHLMKKSK